MEIWKKVYEYDYEISSEGRIRSLDRIVNTGLNNQLQVIRKGKILKPNIKKGYLTIDMCKNGVKKTISLHRLVAKAFILNPDGKHSINHINSIKTDNRVSNLEWCTPKENTQHALKEGLIYSKHRKQILCKEENIIFESSYQAAEWLNKNKYNYSKNIRAMSRNIRAVCVGKRQHAFNYTWQDLV